MLELDVNYPDYNFQRTDKTIGKIPQEWLPSLQRIPQRVVIDTVTEIGLFYDIPQELYMRGIGIPAFRIDEMAMSEITDSYSYGVTGTGLYLSKNDFVVLVTENKELTEKKSLVHELLHGLRSTRALGSRTEIDNYGHGIPLAEEAVVSILECALIYKDIPLLIDESRPKGDTILRRILRERIEFPYCDQIVAMLAIMQGTRCGSNPMTIKELADRYFNDGIYFRRDLMRELKARIPEEDEDAYRDNFEMLPW